MNEPGKVKWTEDVTLQPTAPASDAPGVADDITAVKLFVLAQRHEAAGPTPASVPMAPVRYTLTVSGGCR